MTTRVATIRTAILPLLVGGLVAVVSAMGGCGSTNSGLGPGSTGDSLGGQDGSTSGGDDATIGTATAGDGSAFVISQADSSAPKACATGGELDCYVASCPTGKSTTLTGVVYDPAGKNPIYNAIVYVPDSTTGTLPAITEGTNACSTCDASIGNYLAVGITNAKGQFTLTNVPATTHVPLVVQIGKWRREVFLSQVKACTDNAVVAADSRLPANASEGNLPRIAFLSGGADANLGCFLSGLGVSDSEWSAPQGTGHIQVFQGTGGAGVSGGTAPNCSGTAACPLWDTMTGLEYYDIVMLSCEGSPIDRPAPAMANMHAWLNEGGKMFGTHYHYTWFSDGPNNGCPACTDFKSAGDWLDNGSGASPGSASYNIDTTFYAGSVLQQWLANLSPAADNGGQITLSNVATSLGTVTSAAQRWIYSGQGDSSTYDTKYMSIFTPVGGVPKAPDAGENSMPQYCGKAVFSDLHAGGEGNIISILSGDNTLPGLCAGNTALTAQEEALEFLFFDLSACVAPETMQITLPPTNVPQ